MTSRVPINGPLAISIVAILLTAVAILYQVPALAGSLFGPGAGEDLADENLSRLVALHDEQLTTYRERFDGRSVFYKPPAPPAPVQPVVALPAPKPVEVDIGPKPAPSNYQGPSIIGIIGDRVLFFDDVKLRVGEELNGVKVLSTHPPKYAMVQYTKSGCEPGTYEVPVFDFEWLDLEGGTELMPRMPLPGLIIVPAEQPAVAPEAAPAKTEAPKEDATTPTPGAAPGEEPSEPAESPVTAPPEDEKEPAANPDDEQSPQSEEDPEAAADEEAEAPDEGADNNESGEDQEPPAAEAPAPEEPQEAPSSAPDRAEDDGSPPAPSK